MRAAWVSDIHLDRLAERDYAEYKEYLAELKPEMLLISGDIAEGEKVSRSLSDFDETLPFPVYFVLGNHDYYWSGFDETEKNVGALVEKSKNLNWLSPLGVVELSAQTALIGVEGWGDARNGKLDLGRGSSRDLFSINDYKGLDRSQIEELMKARGERESQKLEPKLLDAVARYPNVILLTHVPPFADACLDRSLRICPDYKLPFYSCGAIGELLLEVMGGNPHSNMLVLCGHTHETADVAVTDNLRVRVKESGYGTWWNATMLEIL